MKLEIVNYSKYRRNRFFSYANFVVSGLLISAMIKGPIGNESLFIKYDAPTWLYIVTSFLIFILLISAFNFIFTGVPKVGEMNFNNDQISIRYKKKVEKLAYAQLKKINYSPNLLEDNYNNKYSRIVELVGDNRTEKFNILLTKNEEKQFIESLENISQNHQLLEFSYPSKWKTI